MPMPMSKWHCHTSQCPICKIHLASILNAACRFVSFRRLVVVQKTKTNFQIANAKIKYKNKKPLLHCQSLTNNILSIPTTCFRSTKTTIDNHDPNPGNSEIQPERWAQGRTAHDRDAVPPRVGKVQDPKRVAGRECRWHCPTLAHHVRQAHAPHHRGGQPALLRRLHARRGPVCWSVSCRKRRCFFFLSGFTEKEKQNENENEKRKKKKKSEVQVRTMVLWWCHVLRSVVSTNTT